MIPPTYRALAAGVRSGWRGIYGGEKGEALRGDAGVEADGLDHRSLRLHLPAPPR